MQSQFALRALRASRIPARNFSATVVARKTATESASDAVKNVDKTVSQTIVSGIEKGGELFRRGISRKAGN